MFVVFKVCSLTNSNSLYLEFVRNLSPQALPSDLGNQKLRSWHPQASRGF